MWRSERSRLEMQHIWFLLTDPDEPQRVFQILILNKRAAKSSVEITNENLAEANHLYITLAWMLHELLIYGIKTCYGCITIYLSISDSPGRLPWGFSHIQSRPLWHTLLSLFKYPVTSPSGPGTQRHVIKSSISPPARASFLCAWWRIDFLR